MCLLLPTGLGLRTEQNIGAERPGRRNQCVRMQGCLVQWNPLEKTFDCPCHGSAFSKDGICIQVRPGSRIAWRQDPSLTMCHASPHVQHSPVCRKRCEVANAFKLLHTLCRATVGHTLLQALSWMRLSSGLHAQGPAKADLEAVEL